MSDVMQDRPTLAQRFWARVEKSDGCWMWRGSTGRKGYGYIARGAPAKGSIRTHRAAWLLTHGDVPSDREVCHTCDNPSCVNPDHLFLGDRFDNMRDMVQKGRHWCQQKTHCKQGHEFTPENTVARRDAGMRRCLTCRRESDRIGQKRRRDNRNAIKSTINENAA